MVLLHVVTLQLALDSHKPTPWHSLAPQTRLLCILLSVFAVALTPNGRWWTWGIYGLGVFGLVALSRVTRRTLLQRVAIEFAFVGAILLGTLFREGGKVVWSWGLFKITTAGLTVLGSVTLKVFLSLLLVNVLVMTTSFPALLQAFLVLRTPPLLVAIVASMYRYISVLITEFNTMRCAALSRNLMAGKRTARLAIGNTIGVLFIRTYERGERIYQAMLARGYRGVLPVEKVALLRKRDILALTVTAMIALLGQVIYL